MKKILFILFITAMQLHGFYNPFSSTIQGSATYTDKTFDKTLTINGCFTGTRLKTKDITVHGAAEIVDSTVDGALDISGSLTIEDSKVSGKVITRGGITAKKTEFNDTIQASGLVKLTDSTTKDIFVKGKKSKVVLEGNTTVNGVINFESKKGTVIISKDAIVTGGVKGGTIEKEAEVTETGPIIKGKIESKK